MLLDMYKRLTVVRTYFHKSFIRMYTKYRINMILHYTSDLIVGSYFHRAFIVSMYGI